MESRTNLILVIQDLYTDTTTNKGLNASRFCQYRAMSEGLTSTPEGNGPQDWLRIRKLFYARDVDG
jgi:hypothetical protein